MMQVATVIGIWSVAMTHCQTIASCEPVTLCKRGDGWRVGAVAKTPSLPPQAWQQPLVWQGGPTIDCPTQGGRCWCRPVRSGCTPLSLRPRVNRESWLAHDAVSNTHLGAGAGGTSMTEEPHGRRTWPMHRNMACQAWECVSGHWIDTARDAAVRMSPPHTRSGTWPAVMDTVLPLAHYSTWRCLPLLAFAARPPWGSPSKSPARNLPNAPRRAALGIPRNMRHSPRLPMRLQHACGVGWALCPCANALSLHPEAARSNTTGIGPLSGSFVHPTRP